MFTIPPQSPPVVRDWSSYRGDEPDDTAEVAGLRYSGAVEASQSRCDNLRGPAQSMCYAALYGVNV
jgi:hypothetical protein